MSNREILFRGKSVKTNDWVQGYLLQTQQKCGAFIVNMKVGCAWLCEDEVLPETVGQYTGLVDKNGTKIFDGDIVEIALDDEVATIEYDELTARFIIEAETFIADFDNYYGKDLEVIGNIHDNPDLIKEIEKEDD
jgi:hypothetical protein